MAGGCLERATARLIASTGVRINLGLETGLRIVVPLGIGTRNLSMGNGEQAAPSCSFADRSQSIWSMGGRRTGANFSSRATTSVDSQASFREALRTDITGVMFENPYATLKKELQGPFIVDAMIRDAAFCGRKGVDAIRKVGLVPGVVSGLFGPGTTTPIAVDGKHFKKLNRLLGRQLVCTPMRLSFPGIKVPGHEDKPFAPQVIAHMVQRMSIGRTNMNNTVPWSVRFKFAPAHAPVSAWVPIALKGMDENPSVKKGRTWEFMFPVLQVEAETPSALPQSIEVDVSVSLPQLIEVDVSNDGPNGIHRLRDVAESLPPGVKLIGYKDMEQAVIRVMGRKRPKPDVGSDEA